MNISELLTRPHDMNPGRAAPYLEDFAAQMALVGHTSFTINGYLDSAIHFGGWAEATGLDFADINEETIKAFGAHCCECPGRRSQKHVSRMYTARVQRFAEYLRLQGAIGAATSSTREIPSSLSAFHDWLLRHRGLAMVTVERHERLITRMLPTLGADADSTTRPRCGRSSWIRYAAAGPLMPKQSSELSASICDSLQRMARASPVSTIHCRPWRNGSSHHCRGTSMPHK